MLTVITVFSASWSQCFLEDMYPMYFLFVSCLLSFQSSIIFFIRNSVFMCENGKMRPVETIPGMGEEGKGE
jgi:hypothetical protein